MGFKTQLDIGCFDWGRASGDFLTRSLTVAEVDAAIVECGGRPLADVAEPQLTAIAGMMVERGAQDVRGFLGLEPVVRHPSGYARLALDQRSAGPVAAFVRLLCAEYGCGVYLWDHDEREPARVIAWLDELAEQRHAEPGAGADGGA